MNPEIKKLSFKFFVDYPSTIYTEIEQDPYRPYMLLVFPLNNDLFLCAPFRTHMNHSNGYSFSNSVRSLSNKSGIDYSKTVVIKNLDYLDSDQVIDQDEYTEMITNLEKIKNHLVQYVSDYVNHHNKSNELHPREYSRRYRFCTLKYFHDLLDI